MFSVTTEASLALSPRSPESSRGSAGCNGTRSPSRSHWRRQRWARPRLAAKRKETGRYPHYWFAAAQKLTAAATTLEKMSALPEWIGPYTITGKLGEGGMGIVYSANDTRLNRPVALKMILDSGDDEDSRKRFHARSAGGGASHPPQYLPHIRHRRGGRPAVPGDGTARRGVDIRAPGSADRCRWPKRCRSC